MTDGKCQSMGENKACFFKVTKLIHCLVMGHPSAESPLLSFTSMHLKAQVNI